MNEAITAKYVALRLAGAEFAIQASMGIMEIWPSGDSSAVFTRCDEPCIDHAAGQRRGPFVKSVIHADDGGVRGQTPLRVRKPTT